jgi:hypothetical protein
MKSRISRNLKIKNTVVSLTLLALVTVLMLVGMPGNASAQTVSQTDENQQSYVVKAGSYNLLVTLGSSNLKTGEDVPLQISFTPDNPTNITVQNTSLQAEIVPSNDISANLLRVVLKPSADGKAWQATLNFPVSGPWSINLTLNGPAGNATATTSFFSIAAPPAIPVWLGWIIALLPALYLLLYLVYLTKKAWQHYTKNTPDTVELSA